MSVCTSWIWRIRVKAVPGEDILATWGLQSNIEVDEQEVRMTRLSNAGSCLKIAQDLDDQQLPCTTAKGSTCRGWWKSEQEGKDIASKEIKITRLSYMKYPFNLASSSFFFSFSFSWCSLNRDWHLTAVAAGLASLKRCDAFKGQIYLAYIYSKYCDSTLLDNRPSPVMVDSPNQWHSLKWRVSLLRRWFTRPSSLICP